MYRLIWLKIALITALLSTTGCNAIGGLGRDIQEAAQATEQALFDDNG